jgi:hypothetical protein
MSNRAKVLASTLAAALTLPLAAYAHHSFAAEFDSAKPVVIEGTVVKFAWVNPHSWLYIDVPKSDGTVDHWKVEGGAPSALLRKGWNRNSLPAGTKVVVNGFRARDGALRANARDITFPDGKKLDLASSYKEKEQGAAAPAPQP